MCKFNHIRWICCDCYTPWQWQVLDGEYEGKKYKIKPCENPTPDCLKKSPKLLGNLNIDDNYPCLDCIEKRAEARGLRTWEIECECIGLLPGTCGTKA